MDRFDKQDKTLNKMSQRRNKESDVHIFIRENFNIP